jgi:predicted ATP-grasp superfamily ATP-dependent carboligase
MRTPGYAVPLILLGDGITVLGALRACGSAGIPVLAAANSALLRRSRQYRSAAWLTPLSDRDADLNDVLKQAPIERAVLLPCSDRWLDQVSALPESTLARFPAPIPEASVVRRVVNKASLAQLVDQLSLAAPRTWSLDRLPTDLPADLWSAAFLKPDDSHAFQARFGKKAEWTRSVEEAVQRAGDLLHAGFTVELQEYIPGPPANHLFVDGYAHDGRPVAVFLRRRERMFPPDFGNSTAMRSVPPDDAPAALAAVSRLLSHLRYRGIFSAEFKQDARDGRYCLIEVNARPWWYIEFAERCGVPVCELAYRDGLGLPLPEAPGPYQVGRRCVYPYYDVDAHRLRHPGRVRWVMPWLAATLGAWQPVFRFTDPGPAVGAVWEAVIRRLRRTGRVRGVTSASQPG